MKHVRVKILRPGDVVLNVTESQIVVRRGNGEVDLFGYVIENGLPRLDTTTRVTITYGDGVVEIAKASPEPPPKGGRKGARARPPDREDEDEVLSGTF